MPATQNAKVLPAAPVQDLTDVAGDVLRPKGADGAQPEALARSQGTAKVLFGLTPLAAAFRFIEPSWRNYIMYVDMEARSGNLEAQHYLRTWQALQPKERQTHVPEQLCDLASVASQDLVSWVTRQVWIEASGATSMVLSFNRAKVLERTAEFAMADAANGRHADLFMKVAGMMPQAPRSGGQTFNMMPVASSGSVALAGSKSDSSPVGSTGLRDMDQEIVELSRIMQRDDATVPLSAAELLTGDEEQDDERDEDDDED